VQAYLSILHWFYRNNQGSEEFYKRGAKHLLHSVSEEREFRELKAGECLAVVEIVMGASKFASTHLERPLRLSANKVASEVLTDQVELRDMAIQRLIDLMDLNKLEYRECYLALKFLGPLRIDQFATNLLSCLVS
jgi:hypothetical protein